MDATVIEVYLDHTKNNSYRSSYLYYLVCLIQPIYCLLFASSLCLFLGALNNFI